MKKREYLRKSDWKIKKGGRSGEDFSRHSYFRWQEY